MSINEKEGVWCVGAGVDKKIQKKKGKGLAQHDEIKRSIMCGRSYLIFSCRKKIFNIYFMIAHVYFLKYH